MAVFFRLFRVLLAIISRHRSEPILVKDLVMSCVVKLFHCASVSRAYGHGASDGQCIAGATGNAVGVEGECNTNWY